MPNKITREIKEMVTTALNNAGGVKYLTKQAKDNPTAFLSLVGKIIPLQVNAKHTVQHDTTILEERRAYAAEISQRLQ